MITETALPSVFVIDPERHRDDRGAFFESFRADALGRETGRPFEVRQINYSTSRRNTLRGLHGVACPPGQAKLVTCVRGELLDVVVDLRPGSATFGAHVRNRLDARNGRAVFVPEGFGHGFLALADDTCISYAVSTTYVPGTQIHVNALDPALALPWGLTGSPVRSALDAGAPTLLEALDAGLLTVPLEQP
ncbi:dTDP-4-dehydrorhamnose 3,5-epimerase family protein [Actinomadura terrae]|uniref:dTDP-4-dehydrorhamnose 3,5-epimerase family protein n=1 Tax=Actinomadura terrae TaxID=604353 RepID=UPI001FA78EA2|nr:dTDP-4-dehydrorhamnose 3,5-epimerase [Actinomadura terrae]